jgi:hypothetical protein
MMEIDLNAPGQDEDNPQEVIINPMQPLQGDFLELADLFEGNNAVQEVYSKTYMNCFLKNRT